MMMKKKKISASNTANGKLEQADEVICSFVREIISLNAILSLYLLNFAHLDIQKVETDALIEKDSQNEKKKQ